MTTHVKKVAAAVASSLALMATTDSHAQGEENNVKFEITPYLWGVGTDAEVKIRGQKFDIDESTSDFFDRVDSAGSLLGGFSIGHWVSFGQVDYFKTDTSELDNAAPNAKFESKTLFATLATGYQFVGGFAEGQTFDVMLGARYMRREPKVKLFGVSFEQNRDIIDPLLVLRPSIPLSARWRFNPTLSVGGGGDSDFTYELQPQFQFQFTDHLAGRIGYRRVSYDIAKDNDTTKFDGTFEGFIIGLGGNFGNEPYRMAKKEPEPAPAPAAVAAVTPPPAPPASIDTTDTDNDGVPDFRDKCAGTPTGTEVDPVGCGYNTKLQVQFETNSAQLKPESYPELDRAVEAMKATPTFNAVVEGYTDSSGSADHNKELSQRRAKAVASYLIEKGVSPDRLETKGYGEAKPEANNNTEEGRAENRRVILRRFDSKG